MDSADRSAREGFLVEPGEDLADGCAEALLDLLLDVREGDWRDFVLELLQLGDDVGRHHVGACRRDLPELDERGPRSWSTRRMRSAPETGFSASPFARSSLETSSASGGALLAPLGGGSLLPVPGTLLGFRPKPARGDDLAEPMLHEHARDSAEASEIAYGRDDGNHAGTVSRRYQA